MRGGFNWELSSLNDPYAVCCLVFALCMIPAGKCQDKMGPRITAIIGGILVGIGFILISQTTSYIMWILGFGVLVGAGIGFGYSSATPPALKWYSPQKTGMVAGIVVSGFGLASVYIAPLAKYLLNIWGLNSAMLFFGILFIIVLISLSTFLVNPPEGYVPEDFVERRSAAPENKTKRSQYLVVNITPEEMIKDRAFWILWTLYAIGAGSGLMVIGNVAGMAKKSMGSGAFLAVAILAIGNAGGRIAAGMISDKIGRKKTLTIIFIFQSLLMFLSIPFIGNEGISPIVLLLLATLLGFNYGANLSIFPAFTKDLWGAKNFGVNYGIMFTSWGIGGFIMSKISQLLIVKSGSFTYSFITAGILLLVGTALTINVKSNA